LVLVLGLSFGIGTWFDVGVGVGIGIWFGCGVGVVL
jgi:hypothetical protein